MLYQAKHLMFVTHISTMILCSLYRVGWHTKKTFMITPTYSHIQVADKSGMVA